MALTTFQREICRVLAQERIASGESYVAGAAALNELMRAPRVSRDIDLFHDTSAALAATWDLDRQLLMVNDFQVRIVHERPAFVEADVSRGEEQVRLQWVQDSAYRFFPLIQREPFGLTLHPFDLATNKVLALVGRVEVRDWIDTLESSERIQPLGYLAWAACGKDPGFSPLAIVEHAARSSRYSADEVDALIFDGPPPDAAVLSRTWHRIMEEARLIVETLPASETGRCVLRPDGTLYTGDARSLREDLASGAVRYHRGSIRGALPDLMANGGLGRTIGSARRP
jgi:hypothetical protein